MSDLSWLAPTITSLGVLLVAVITALRSRDNGIKVEAVAAKVETVLEKATEIHAATNGTLHAVTASRDVLAERVEGLEKRLTAALESKVLAATVAAQAATDVREAQAATPPAHEEPAP